MTQTKLVINVYENVSDLSDLFSASSDHVISVDPANVDNVRSCIDLWHKPNTAIVLTFEEFEVQSSNN